MTSTAMLSTDVTKPTFQNKYTFKQTSSTAFSQLNKISVIKSESFNLKSSGITSDAKQTSNVSLRRYETFNNADIKPHKINVKRSTSNVGQTRPSDWSRYSREKSDVTPEHDVSASDLPLNEATTSTRDISDAEGNRKNTDINESERNESTTHIEIQRKPAELRQRKPPLRTGSFGLADWSRHARDDEKEETGPDLTEITENVDFKDNHEQKPDMNFAGQKQCQLERFKCDKPETGSPLVKSKHAQPRTIDTKHRDHLKQRMRSFDVLPSRRNKMTASNSFDHSDDGLSDTSSIRTLDATLDASCSDLSLFNMECDTVSLTPSSSDISRDNLTVHERSSRSGNDLSDVTHDDDKDIIFAKGVIKTPSATMIISGNKTPIRRHMKPMRRLASEPNMRKPKTDDVLSDPLGPPNDDVTHDVSDRSEERHRPKGPIALIRAYTSSDLHLAGVRTIFTKSHTQHFTIRVRLSGTHIKK